MKTINTLIMLSTFFFFKSIPAFSQDRDRIKALAIDPYHLTIGLTKTTNLLFPYAIKSVDKGSNAVWVQKANGVDNILQVKAGRVEFKETNLTVITADGKLYSFLLNFEEDPAVLTLVFENRESLSSAPSILANSPSEAELVGYAKLAAQKKKTLKGIHHQKHGIQFSLESLFINDGVMYYGIRIENESNIKYDIDQLRFFIRDRKRARRTATQEIEMNPLHVNNPIATVHGQSSQSMVYALAKFTIPDQKYLIVQLMEQGGGRHLELKIDNKILIRSTVLNLIEH